MPVQARCTVLTLGAKRAQWTICPDMITAESIIYSVGVGSDISFDLELIRRFGVRVYAFDPTPRSIAWVESQNLPQEFVFYGFGIGNFDGLMTFHPPDNPSFVSYSAVHATREDDGVRAPVHRLSAIMSILGHQKIDLLKMDIEGAEYDVIDDLIDSRLQVQQILVEFHHGWPEIGIEKTKNAINRLNQSGYMISHVSETGEEYSFCQQ